MTKDTTSCAKELASVRSNPVLASEAAAEMERLRDEFFREVRPADFIERMYANEVVELYCEARKLRRAKVELVNSSRTLALRDLLVLGKGEMFGGTNEAEQELAVRCQRDPLTQETVTKLLRERGLDASAIEAQAMCIRLQELEKLDRMIASVESRRDRALLKISDYRLYFASSLRRVETRMIEAETTAPERNDVDLKFADALE